MDQMPNDPHIPAEETLFSCFRVDGMVLVAGKVIIYNDIVFEWQELGIRIMN